MATPLEQKSSISQIRQRFDHDVERFSDIETGQSATIDALLAMQLITAAALAATPQIDRVLDVGCGAGNNTLKLLESCEQGFDVTLLDLSQPMLDRALARVSERNPRSTTVVQADFRHAELAVSSFDVILAAAVLHHLRDENDWRLSFQKLFDVLKPGGSLWITDLVSHEHDGVQQLMWQRYGEYLVTLGGPSYRDKVFDYIDREDSPRSLTYQLELLTSVGFDQVEVLHKNSCFAAFGAVKAKQ